MSTSYRHGCLLAAILVGIAVLAVAPVAQASVWQWDPGRTGPSGGTGTWDNTDCWYDPALGNDVWSDGSTAEFGVVGGTVTNDYARAVAGMNFAVGGYTLSGTGIITLNLGATINTVSTTVSEITSTLAGANGFQKTGAGVLKLTGTNTFSGNVVISEGTLLVGTAAGTPIGGVGTAGPLGVSDSIVFDGGTLGGNAFALGTPNDRSFTINDGKTGTIDPDAGGSSFRNHIQLDGSNNTETTGKLIIGGYNSRQVFLNGTYGFTGGVEVGAFAKGLNFAVLAGIGEPSSIGRVTGAPTDIVFGSDPSKKGLGRILPGTLVPSSTTGAGWTIRDGQVGQIVHYGLPFIGEGGNQIEFSGNAAATTGRLLLHGGNETAPGSGIGIETADDPSRLILSGTNAFSGGVEMSCRFLNEWLILSVGTIANGGTACNLGASSNDPENLIFMGSWLEYTGATATTDRAFKIASQDSNAAATISKPAVDARFIVTNSAATLTMTGNNTVIADTSVRGLKKTGPGTLRLEGTQAWTGTATLFHGKTGAAGYAGTLELGVNAQTPINAYDGTNGGADIQEGTLVLDYSGTAPDVLTDLAAGYAAGWATGKFRSTTAGTTGYMLGWMDDTVGSQISIMATFAGDANLDGVVDEKDASCMGANWLTAGTWQDGDFNYDGAVNDKDAAILAAHWGSSVGAAAGSVPEPSTLAMLLGAAVMAWLVRRRIR